MSANARNTAFKIDYGPEIEAEIAQLQHAIEHTPGLAANGSHHSLRWLAIKLLEGEADLAARVAAAPGGASVVTLARASARALSSRLGDDTEVLLADRRYSFINDVVRQVVRQHAPDRFDVTAAIDAVATHRVLGIPVFLMMMFLVFKLVIDVSASYLEWVEHIFAGPVTRWALALTGAVGLSESWVEALLVEGVIAGVGGVLVFLPGLFVLYFFLTLLEDSGYMARAAFVMDRLMSVLGLHGKSFIPMVLGFGCAVPAIYATRTLRSPRDRLITALLTPLMSCSARLPVYVIFGMAFFASSANVLIWAMYALGIAVAVLYGLVLTHMVFRREPSTGFVLELPPYRMPTLRTLLMHTWERAADFIKRAGTVILAATVVLWLLLNLPAGAPPQESLFGRVSGAIAPALAPAGFGEWESAGALVTGFLAKEVIISSMSTIYVGVQDETPAAEPSTLGEDLVAIGAGFVEATANAARTLLSAIPGVELVEAEAEPQNTALTAALQHVFTPLAALAFVVFVLLYVPCVATLSAIRAEFGTRWALSAAVYQTATAWLLAVGVYQIGRLLGLE